MRNPLLDENFLLKLESNRNREIFARIILLSVNETPIEQIEGKVTGGSIDIDGTSSVRRSCSLTLIAKDVNINDFYWGLKNKFILEIGLKNTIDTDNYEDIIWFKQGIFVISGFNVVLGVNSYTININGKDKMCLLNGDLSGNIMNISEDFGVKWIWKNEEHTEYTAEDIPIKEIIYKGVQTYAGELPQNIIINDIAECGLELLSYRGNTPIYLIKNANSLIYENMTINGNMQFYLEDGTAISVSELENYGGNYETEITTEINQSGIIPTKVFLSPGDEVSACYIYKVSAGMTTGYRLTELVYAGELLASANDTFTSVLDKIVDMLGNFEYFYDIDGHFVFQRKKNYATGNWTGLSDSETQGEKITYALSNDRNDTFSYIFDDSYLITNIQNSPNLAEVKNDYSVWGVRKTASGVEIPIHMRCAIDDKPVYYKTFDGKEYSTKAGDEWREIIYQMAQDYYHHNSEDDFYIKLRKNNTILDEDGEMISYYPSGRTGYERYYTDMEAFWRGLYTPTEEVQINKSKPVDKDTYGLKGYWIYDDNSENGKPEYKRFLQAVDIIPVDENKNYRSSYDDLNNYTNYKTFNIDNTYYDKLKDTIDVDRAIKNGLFYSSQETPKAFYEPIEDIILRHDIKNTKELIQINQCEVKNNENTTYYNIRTSGAAALQIQIGSPYLVIDDKGNFLTQTVLPIPPSGVIYAYVVKNEEGKYIPAKGENSYIINMKTITISPTSTLYLQMYKASPNILADAHSSLILDDTRKVIAVGGTNYFPYINDNGEEVVISIPHTYQYFSNYEYKPIFTLSPQQAYAKVSNENKEQIQDILTKGVYSIYQKIDGQSLAVSGKDIVKYYVADDQGWLTKEKILISFPTQTNYNWEIADRDSEDWKEIIVFKYKEEYEKYKFYSQEIQPKSFWNPLILKNPEMLDFWIDFLDPITNDLQKYSVAQIGPRSKVVNENSVKAIYYRETPNVLFEEAGVESEFSHQPGYTYVYLNSSQKSLFTMSSQGVSAKDKMENLLNNYTYPAEGISISGVPIYRLDANTRISVKDLKTGISGEYVIQKISIPLTYNGTMSITAAKKVKLIY